MTAVFNLSTVAFQQLPGSYSPRWVGQTYTPDLDGDGLSDLLVLGASYPGDGAPMPQPGLLAFGTESGSHALAASTRFPLAALSTVHPREVVFADLNADGRQDIFIADHGYDASPFPGAQNRLFLSSPDGSWRDASATSLPQIQDFSHSASAGDVDGDGDPDLLVGNVPRPNPVDPYVLLNDGSGNFTRADILPTAAGQPLNAAVMRMTSSLLADLDGDGDADLVAGAFDSSAQTPRPAQVIWNHGGSFAAGDTTRLPLPAWLGATHSVYDIQALDLNHDGRQDLVLAYQASVALGGWELQVLVNHGSGGFVDETTAWIPEAFARHGPTPSAADAQSQYWVQFIRPADLNGDGWADLLIDARGTTSAPSWMPLAYLGQPDGSFDAVSAGEMTAGGQGWLFDFSTQWSQWPGGAGFLHLGLAGGSVTLATLPVRFAPVLPAWQGDTEPVDRVGGSGADLLFGGRAGDRLRGHGGNDTLDGGDGTDLAFFAGARAAATVQQADGATTVTTSADGADRLTHIERLLFEDMALALDLDGHAGLVARVLGAAGGPAAVADPALAGIGLQLMDSGVSEQSLMGLALTALLGPQPAHAAVVDLLFRNLTGSAAPADALASFTGLLDQGAFTPAALGVLAAHTALNEARIDLVGLAQHGLPYLA